MSKESVIEDKLTDPSDIQDAISDAADKQGITLTDDQFAKITSLMESISQYDYDVKALKKTLDNLDGKSGGFFSNLWSSIKGFFGHHCSESTYTVSFSELRLCNHLLPSA